MTDRSVSTPQAHPTETTPSTEATARPNLARSTAIMTAGTILSRATGMLRLIAIAAALGIAGNKVADTYNLANTAPNIIYELVLGGVLTSVFVPVFVDLLEKEGRERAWRVASAILNVSVLALLGVTIIGLLAAPLIASVYALRLEGDQAVAQQQVMTDLLRWFIPQVIFYGLTALTTGLLNAHKRFGPPMYTPVLNNLVVIAVFVVFFGLYGSVQLETLGADEIVLLGAGTTAGVVAMALAQLPFLRGLGHYDWRAYSLRHPALRRLAKLSVFVIGYVIVHQIGYIIVQWLSNAQTGGYTAYVSAFMFFMLPHGLFAVSVMTALLPDMSRYASNERWDDYRNRLSTGIRATFFLILPAAVGYFMLSNEIVRLLLQRGNMTASDTILVGSVLRVMVLGLVPFSLFQLFLRAFYAQHDSKTPFLISIVAVTVNIGVNIPLFAVFGVQGLAVGLVISYLTGSILEAVALRRRIARLDGRRIAASVLRIGGAALGMGVVVGVVNELVKSALDPGGLLSNSILVLIPVAAGVAAYGALSMFFGVQELDFVRSAIGRRFHR